MPVVCIRLLNARRAALSAALEEQVAECYRRLRECVAALDLKTDENHRMLSHG